MNLFGFSGMRGGLFGTPFPVWFDKDGGGGSGDDDGDPGQNSADPGGDDSPTSEFTPEQQKKVDSLLGQVRREAGKKGGETAIAELLKDLEIDDPNALAALVKSAREAEDAERTEIEKLTAALEKAQKERADFETKRAEDIRAANLRVLKSEVRLAAVAAGVREDALDDVPKLLDLDSLLDTFDSETGTFPGVADQVEKLVKEKEFLAAGNGSPRIGTPPAGEKPKKKPAKGTSTSPIIRF